MKRKILIIENGPRIVISEINASPSQNKRKIKRAHAGPITPASRDRLKKFTSETMYYKGRIGNVVFFKCELNGDTTP